MDKSGNFEKEDFDILAELIVQASYEASASGFENTMDFDEVAAIAHRSVEWVREHVAELDLALSRHTEKELIEYNPDDVHAEEDSFCLCFYSTDGCDYNYLFKNENGRWKPKSEAELLEDEDFIANGDVLPHDGYVYSLIQQGYELNETGLVNDDDASGPHYEIYSDGRNKVTMQFDMQVGKDGAVTEGNITSWKEEIDDDLYSDVENYINERFEFAGEEPFHLNDIQVYHPEEFGFENDGKIHVLVSYSGDIRDDDFFNILHDEENILYSHSGAESVEIDCNPIRDISCEAYLKMLELDYVAHIQRLQESWAGSFQSKSSFIKIPAEQYVRESFGKFISDFLKYAPEQTEENVIDTLSRYGSNMIYPDAFFMKPDSGAVFCVHNEDVAAFIENGMSEEYVHPLTPKDFIDYALINAREELSGQSAPFAINTVENDIRIIKTIGYFIQYTPVPFFEAVFSEDDLLSLRDTCILSDTEENYLDIFCCRMSEENKSLREIILQQDEYFKYKEEKYPEDFKGYMSLRSKIISTLGNPEISSGQTVTAVTDVKNLYLKELYAGVDEGRDPLEVTKNILTRWIAEDMNKGMKLAGFLNESVKESYDAFFAEECGLVKRTGENTVRDRKKGREDTGRER